MKAFKVDLLDDEIQVAEKLSQKYFDTIVDDICTGGTPLKEDQIKIIWASIAVLATQCIQEEELKT